MSVTEPLRQYAVFDRLAGKTLPGIFFTKRGIARQFRQQLCTIHHRPTGFLVVPGPDHPRKRSYESAECLP